MAARVANRMDRPCALDWHFTERRRGRRDMGISRNTNGSAIVAVLIAIAIIAVAGMGAAQITILGALQSRNAREREQARQACGVILDSAPPTSFGGSVHPDATVVGYWDLVAVDPRSGTLANVTHAVSTGAVAFRRQWRLETDETGHRVLAVSCVAMENDLATPRTDDRAIVVRASRVVE
jgi:hypothetical protein